MANPVLVEITRGTEVESRHRGAIAVVRSDGETVEAVGDINTPVYPRSAVKLLQALPLVESGAADAFGFTDAELALACSSHNGETFHVAAAKSMLAKAGLDGGALACGPHWPHRDVDRARMIRAGEIPAPIGNNCSGKHAGMLALARHLGASPEGYEKPDHMVQKVVRAALEEMTGADYAGAARAIDGCSLPTYAVPLQALARAFARLTGDPTLPGDRQTAAYRLMQACFAHPEMVAGTDRFCTVVMTAFGRRVFLKTGAEGVFCAAFPDLKVGVALKCDDGATRASEAIMAGLIAHLLDPSAEESAALARYNGARLSNWAGLDVGTIRFRPPWAAR